MLHDKNDGLVIMMAYNIAGEGDGLAKAVPISSLAKERYQANQSSRQNNS
jgi:hypothetical protein